MMEFVSWDDEILNGKIQNGPNHQPALYCKIKLIKLAGLQKN
jgi:hypothetical protein